MRRSFGIAALAAGILSVSACGPAGRGLEAPALQEESRETEGTQETEEIQGTEEARRQQTRMPCRRYASWRIWARTGASCPAAF